MNMQKVIMALRNETKGAVRYQEIDSNGKPVLTNYILGTLYIRKSALTAPYPKILLVTLEAK